MFESIIWKRTNKLAPPHHSLNTSSLRGNRESLKHEAAAAVPVD